MEKTELPTQERLQALREHGIVPYSSITTYCGLLMTVLLIPLGMRYPFLAFTEKINTVLSAAIELKMMADLFWDALQLVLIPTLVIMFVIVLTGLMQTKFIFVWSNNKEERCNGLIGFIITKILLILSAAVTFIFILHPGIKIGFYSLNNMNGLWDTYLEVLPYLIFALFMISIFSFAVAKYRFLFNNKMTKLEIENEG